MAVLQKKNVNRFRRVYPGIRKSPVYEQGTSIEGGYIDFDNENEGTYSYALNYDEIPSVTASALQNIGDTMNVTLVIGTISTTAVQILSSANITGRVYVQVVGI